MSVREELLSASDNAIEDAVKFADPMVLRGLLHQLTADEEILDLELGSQAFGNFHVKSIARDADVTLIQRKAVQFLKTYRDAGAGDIGIGPSDRLYDSLKLAVGTDLPEAEREIWLEQTALDPWARGVGWQSTPAQSSGFLVAIIGSGLSGLNAAVHLKRAGIPFVVLEKNPEVGGTWFENHYPGARVDSPSRTYTHLFGIDFPYPYNFCPRDENMKYMRWVADSFGLREAISFNTEVKSLVWQESEKQWLITTQTPEGSRTWHANAVISCVGFLSRPNLPDIPGMADFTGLACHTARWPDNLDVTGQRVAVIGSGASGYQTTPEIAKKAAQVVLFQRTPSWCFENPMYVRPLPAQATWLDRNMPYYVNFARFRLCWMYGPEVCLVTTRRDPGFEDSHAGSAANKQSRDDRVAFLRKKLASRPELIEKMTPAAPPMSSRPIMIDSEDSILDALLRDNVTLVTDPVEAITATGIKAGGDEYPVDIIVYATGFKANDFLWPMEVRGRDGVRVEELWAKDGARAYIGSMLPGFPNFFMAYGPNTNNFGGFQIIDLLEIEIRFALRCIAGLIDQQKQSVDVKADAYWRFNDVLDHEEKSMLYMDPRVFNYYRNDHGRSAVNGPVDYRRMWNWLKDPAGPSPEVVDAGLKPHFGEDLMVD